MMWKRLAMNCTALAFAAASSVPAFAAEEWQARIGEALGKTGSAMPGGIYRVGLPLTDLKVTLDGVELKAGFALGSWLAFEKIGDNGMVMGDLVLTMDALRPVHEKAHRGWDRGHRDPQPYARRGAAASSACISGQTTMRRSSPRG